MAISRARVRLRTAFICGFAAGWRLAAAGSRLPPLGAAAPSGRRGAAAPSGRPGRRGATAPSSFPLGGARGEGTAPGGVDTTAPSGGSGGGNTTAPSGGSGGGNTEELVEVGHFHCRHRGVRSFVPGLHSGPVHCLLHRVGGEDPEHHRDLRLLGGA